MSDVGGYCLFCGSAGDHEPDCRFTKRRERAKLKAQAPTTLDERAEAYLEGEGVFDEALSFPATSTKKAFKAGHASRDPEIRALVAAVEQISGTSGGQSLNTRITGPDAMRIANDALKRHRGAK